MKKIFLVLALVLSLFNALQNVDANYTKTIPAYADITGDKVYNGNLKVGNSVEFLDGNVKVNGDLYVADYVDFSGNLEVTGNLIVQDHVDFNGNITVGGNATLGQYTDIKGTLSAKSIKIGDSSDIYAIHSKNSVFLSDYVDITNMSIGGDLTVGMYLDFLGKAKVLGNVYMGDYADIEGTLYVYKNIILQDYADILETHNKLKVVGSLKAGIYYDNTARTYVYGNTSFGAYADEDYSSYGGFFGKIDPLLQYNLSGANISKLRQKINSYIKEASQKASKQQKKNIYISMFNEIEKYIENESFDMQKFNSLRKSYTGQSYTTTATTSSIVYKPYLPENLRQQLDISIAKLPVAKKDYILGVVIERVDVIIASLKAEQQTQETITQINIILGIKQYIESQRQSTNILQQLGL